MTTLIEPTTIRSALDQIKSWVRLYVTETGDVDNLVADIWLESFVSGHKPTRRLTRYRCYDYLRSLRRQKVLESTAAHSMVQNRPVNEDVKIDLDELLKLAELTPTEAQLLYLRFYRELTVVSIGDRMSMSCLAVTRKLSEILERLRRLSDDVTTND